MTSTPTLPKWPVKDPSPELETVIANFKAFDWAVFGTFTIGYYGAGYAGGYPVRAMTASTAGAPPDLPTRPRPREWRYIGMLGSLCGFLLIYQRTSWKLMGLIDPEKF